MTSITHNGSETPEPEDHLDLAEKKKSLPAQLRNISGKDPSPSTQKASSRWVDWNTGLSQTLGMPFDSTSIPLTKLEQMRRDPIINFGLAFCKAPLVRAQWTIKCARADIAAMVDAELRKIWGRLVLALANDMDYGYSPVVKRFELGRPETTYIDASTGEKVEKKVWDKDIDAILWKPFFALNPAKALPHWNAAGEFHGIDYGDVGRTPKLPEQPPDVSMDYALWSTNEKDSVFGSIWGYPRTGYAYRYWWSYWYKFALSDRAFERFADPALIVYHPKGGIDNETGEAVDWSTTALDAGQRVRSGDTVAIPNQMVEGPDGSMINTREWEIKPLDGGTHFDALNQAFEYLDVQKLRSLMVPEQALIEGKGGTSSRNVAATFGDTFEESMAVKFAEIIDLVNRFVIPQFVTLNFGADAPRAELVSKGFDSEDIDTMREIVRLVGQVSPNELHADLPAILNRLGIPQLSPIEVQKQLDRAAEIASQTLPPPTAGDETQASVNDEGLYEVPRQVIWLSELPKTRQYSDPTVIQEAGLLQALWSDELTLMYESFAKYLEKNANKLGLAEDDDDSAKDIVARWRYPLTKAKNVTMKAIGRIMKTAAVRELQAFGLSQANFSMDNPEVQDWMTKRGAFLVRSINSTVRKELRDFLTERLKEEKDPFQIAADVRAHFAQFPSWKADRIARTETRDAYNGAALLGYKSSGVALVQAFDGGGGLTGETDPECLARNGQVFQLEDALKEDEHPNGTLGWRPIVADRFSQQIIPQIELPEEGMLHYYDEGDQVLYMAEGLGSEERREILLDIGERLSRS